MSTQKRSPESAVQGAMQHFQEETFKHAVNQADSSKDLYALFASVDIMTHDQALAVGAQCCGTELDGTVDDEAAETYMKGMQDCIITKKVGPEQRGMRFIATDDLAASLDYDFWKGLLNKLRFGQDQVRAGTDSIGIEFAKGNATRSLAKMTADDDPVRAPVGLESSIAGMNESQAYAYCIGEYEQANGPLNRSLLPDKSATVAVMQACHQAPHIVPDLAELVVFFKESQEDPCGHATAGDAPSS